MSDDVPFGMHETNLAPWEQLYAPPLATEVAAHGLSAQETADLHARLVAANDRLSEMADADGASRERLIAKATGVRLALSYLEEYLR